MLSIYGKELPNPQAEEWRGMRSEEVRGLYASKNIIQVIKSRIMR
jgi:hypothetical protein